MSRHDRAEDFASEQDRIDEATSYLIEAALVWRAGRTKETSAHLTEAVKAYEKAEYPRTVRLMRELCVEVAIENAVSESGG